MKIRARSVGRSSIGNEASAGDACAAVTDLGIVMLWDIWKHYGLNDAVVSCGTRRFLWVNLLVGSERVFPIPKSTFPVWVIKLSSFIIFGTL